jgi:hypothetical protein
VTKQILITDQTYVSCFQERQIMVVDPRLGVDGRRAIIPTGNGPYNLVLNFGGEPEGGLIEPCADPFISDKEAERRGIRCPPGGALRVRPLPAQGDLPPRAYVTTYLDNTIEVIDLRPGSPTQHRVVSRIGKPAPKQSQ